MTIIIFVIVLLVAIKFIQQIIIYLGDFCETYRSDAISKHIDRIRQQQQREELINQYKRNNVL